MQDCIFCKIVKGELPSHKIWENETHMAFLSIFPNTDGFAVVIPKKHTDSIPFEDLPDDILTDLTLASKQVAAKIKKAFKDVGRVGLIFEGLGVNHLHMKLFPMHGTGNMEEWKPSETKMDLFFNQYPGYISSHDSKQADNEHLKKIADKINSVK